MKDEKSEIAGMLKKQAGVLFRRRNVSAKDKELVEKWVEEFARFCEKKEVKDANR